MMGKVQVGLAAAAAVFATGEVVSLWFGAFAAVGGFAHHLFVSLGTWIAVGIRRRRTEDGE